jgi:hypothetical protein
MKPIQTFSHKNSKSEPVEFYKAMKLIGNILLSKKKAYNTNYSHFQMLDESTLLAHNGFIILSVNTKLPSELSNLCRKRFYFDSKTPEPIADDFVCLPFEKLLEDIKKNLNMFVITSKQFDASKGKNILFKTPQIATINGDTVSEVNCSIHRDNAKILAGVCKALKLDCLRFYSDFAFSSENAKKGLFVEACDSNGNAIVKGVVQFDCGVVGEGEWGDEVNAMVWSEKSFGIGSVGFLKLN